jgi:dTDP-3-amino-3,4,6-trideoxy-alpha-D-glucose transaminase
LRARLQWLPAWTERRRALARRYRSALADSAVVTVPPERDAGHVYHLFPVLSTAREAVREHLRQTGVETLIHYPIPIHKQKAIESSDSCPVAERICDQVFSLPLYPALDDIAVQQVASALRDCVVTTTDRS